MELKTTKRHVRNREYYQENKELIKSKVDKEKMIAYNKEYRKNNKEKIQKKNKQYAIDKADALRAKARAWWANKTPEQHAIHLARRAEVRKLKKEGKYVSKKRTK